jgi:hypothetical protein
VGAGADADAGAGAGAGIGIDPTETELELVFLDAGIVTELGPHDYQNFTAVFGACSPPLPPLLHHPSSQPVFGPWCSDVLGLNVVARGCFYRLARLLPRRSGANHELCHTS